MKTRPHCSIPDFHEDIQDFVLSFMLKGGSVRFACLREYWRDYKFSLIHHAPIYTHDTEAFTQSLFCFLLRFLDPDTSLQELLPGRLDIQAGLELRCIGLFMLYLMYQTQLNKPKVKIYLSPGGLANILTLLKECKDMHDRTRPPSSAPPPSSSNATPLTRLQQSSPTPIPAATSKLEPEQSPRRSSMESQQTPLPVLGDGYPDEGEGRAATTASQSGGGDLVTEDSSGGGCDGNNGGCDGKGNDGGGDGNGEGISGGSRDGGNVIGGGDCAGIVGSGSGSNGGGGGGGGGSGHRSGDGIEGGGEKIVDGGDGGGGDDGGGDRGDGGGGAAAGAGAGADGISGSDATTSGSGMQHDAWYMFIEVGSVVRALFDEHAFLHGAVPSMYKAPVAEGQNTTTEQTAPSNSLRSAALVAAEEHLQNFQSSFDFEDLDRQCRAYGAARQNVFSGSKSGPASASHQGANTVGLFDSTLAARLKKGVESPLYSLPTEKQCRRSTKGIPRKPSIAGQKRQRDDASNPDGS